MLHRFYFISSVCTSQKGFFNRRHCQILSADPGVIFRHDQSVNFDVDMWNHYRAQNPQSLGMQFEDPQVCTRFLNIFIAKIFQELKWKFKIKAQLKTCWLCMIIALFFKCRSLSPGTIFFVGFPEKQVWLMGLLFFWVQGLSVAIKSCIKCFHLLLDVTC